MQDNSWRRSPFECKEYGNGYTELLPSLTEQNGALTDTIDIPSVKTTTTTKTLREAYFENREVILDRVHINVKDSLHKIQPYGPVRELLGDRLSKCAKCTRVFPGKVSSQYVSKVIWGGGGRCKWMWHSSLAS